MNERIRELAEHATEYAQYSPFRQDKTYDEILMDKFAELIVKECLSVLHKTAVESTLKDEWDKAWQSGVVSGFELVEEHFGVKYEPE